VLVQLVSVCTLGQRRLERVILTVHVHTSTLQPRDLGLAAHSPSAHVHWPFVRGFPTTGVSPVVRDLVKYHVEQEGRRSVKPNPSCTCWVAQSSW